MDLETNSKNALVSSLSDQGARKELDYIKAVGDLISESSNDNFKNNTLQIKKRIGEFAPYEPGRQTIERKADRLAEKGTIRINRQGGKGNGNIHELTEKGWELYEGIKPLYADLSEVQDAVNEVYEDRKLDSNKHAVEVKLGRSISRNTYLQALNKEMREIEDRQNEIQKKIKDSSERMDEIE